VKISRSAAGVSRVDEALSALRSRIENRDLMPGEALRLDALSQELEMSVQPVREALRLLESEGLVERSINRGVIVAKMTLEQVIELACLRTIIEPMITSLAAVRATPDELAAIRASHEELRAQVEAGSPWEPLIPATIAWHEQVYAAAHSRYLSDFVARVWTAIRINSAWRTSHASDTLPEHEAILAALEQHDATAAASAMRSHVRESVIGHLEGFSGASGPTIMNAIATYDGLLAQLDPSHDDHQLLPTEDPTPGH
jgi:DNA-binding GntR family transcriptional regulator